MFCPLNPSLHELLPIFSYILPIQKNQLSQEKAMKKISAVIFILLISSNFIFCQHLKIGNAEKDSLIAKAFNLAVWTIDHNTREGILAAGADYGGEWVRDISINSWNGTSLFRPAVAEKSLWSVTINKDTIGHQYWDRIIWVIGAWNHYKTTGNKIFLKQAYICSKNSIADLEKKHFDKQYGLFMGPAHLCDGIAGYPEPPYAPANKSSFVLDHPNTNEMKSLSTNAIYVAAYQSLALMGKELQAPAGEVKEFIKKEIALKNNINKHFWNKEKNRYGYLILKDGKKDLSQEGIGIAYSLMFGIPDKEQAKLLFKNIVLMPQGITCIYPNFPRFTDEKPGRHNNIVWPMISGFWGYAAKEYKEYKIFTSELENQAHFAMDADKGNGNFKEIYHAITGKPDGGWQCDHQWKSCDHQTWSATAYTRMVLYGMLGISFETNGISFAPYIPAGYGDVTLENIKYRNAEIKMKVKGAGDIIKSFSINGKKAKKAFLPAGVEGKQIIEIEMAK
jgi:hypothetical protein